MSLPNAPQDFCERTSKMGTLTSIGTEEYGESDDTILTNSISVGLPSEGSVSSSLLMQCNS